MGKGQKTKQAAGTAAILAAVKGMKKGKSAKKKRETASPRYDRETSGDRYGGSSRGRYDDSSRGRGTSGRADSRRRRRSDSRGRYAYDRGRLPNKGVASSYNNRLDSSRRDSRGRGIPIDRRKDSRDLRSKRRDSRNVDSEAVRSEYSRFKAPQVKDNKSNGAWWKDSKPPESAPGYPSEIDGLKVRMKEDATAAAQRTAAVAATKRKSDKEEVK